MTYLLTEIALGILGHKFYDIDGVPNCPNFQESSLKQFGVPSEEAPLQQLLDLEEPTTQMNEIEISAAEEESTLAVTTNNESALPSESTSQSGGHKIVQNKQQSRNAVSTNAYNKFNKLLRYEHARLREQVRRNKLQHLTTFVELGKKERALEKRFDILAENFHTKERERLLKDLSTLVEFRLVTERKVSVLNEDTFKKYNDTFSNTQQIGSLNTQNK